MPDWVSHILFALIIAELLNTKKKSLIVLGSVLPDIILKFYTVELLLPIKLDTFYWLAYPTHTIVGMLLVAFIMTIFFRYDTKIAFALLSIGGLSHLLLDLTTRYLRYNIQGLLLFPFSWASYSLNLFDTEQFWALIFVFIAVYFLIRYIKKRAKNEQRI